MCFGHKAEGGEAGPSGAGRRAARLAFCTVSLAL